MPRTRPTASGPTPLTPTAVRSPEGFLSSTETEEAQRLRTRLGQYQDLAVLAALTAPHQPLAPWRSRLTPLIEARRDAHLKTAARLAGRLFAEKPKAFRRRIAALWSASDPRNH